MSPDRAKIKWVLSWTVTQGIESAVIALIAEGKLQIYPGKGMLYPKAHAVAATIQIAFQPHAKLAREVSVVHSCDMLVEDALATFPNKQHTQTMFSHYVHPFATVRIKRQKFLSSKKLNPL